MSAENGMLLPEADQFRLALTLQEAGLLGIAEDPNDTQQLKSGRLSPHYFNARNGISSPKIRFEVASTLVNLVRRRANIRMHGGTVDGFVNAVPRIYDHFAGTPEAMTSYAAIAAHLAGMSLLQPRVALEKSSGNKAPILGSYNKGDKVAAFDDVVTEGAAKLEAIERFTAADLVVKDYFVLLDREEGGAPNVYEVTGIKVTPALGVSSMVKLLRAEHRISIQQFDNVARYLEQYGEPHARETINSAN